MATYPVSKVNEVTYVIYSSRRTICAASKPRVHSRAECRLSLFTIPTTSIGHVERHDDTVALFQQGHSLAELLDDSQVLVAYTLMG